MENKKKNKMTKQIGLIKKIWDHKKKKIIKEKVKKMKTKKNMNLKTYS